MAADFFATIDETSTLFIVVLVGVVAGFGVERFLSYLRRRAWRARQRAKWSKTPGVKPGEKPNLQVVPTNTLPLHDPAEQLRTVMSADFSIRPLLNNKEARVFRELDRMVLDRNPGWQVMAQVSLGEILSSKDNRAYGCINSKRVDLLLVDEHCKPRHAVEDQGTGHYRGTAAARDAVKKEAMRKAGISYHEVIAGHTTPSELQLLVNKLVPAARVVSDSSSDPLKR